MARDTPAEDCSTETSKTPDDTVSVAVRSLLDSCSPIINALATATSLGGSRLHPAALRAMSEVSTRFVDLNILLTNAGKHVAALARAPDGYGAHIVTGAAAGLAHAVSACLTGRDIARVRMLPDVSQLERFEVILDGASDHRWNQSIALTGAKLKIVGDASQPMDAESLRSALPSGHRTAAVVLFDGYVLDSKPLVELIQVAHDAGVPVIVDAAARLPPVSNLWTIPATGADLVLFSGGKAIRGPQTSGLMIGRTSLIEAARLNGCPNEAAVCRSMKCSKECIVGLVAALEVFVSEQPTSGYEADWNERAKTLARMLKDIPGIRVHLEKGPTDIQPSSHEFVHVYMHEPERRAKKSKLHDSLYGDSVDHGNPLAVPAVGAGGILASRLASGSPRICTNTTSSGILLNPQTLEDADLPVLVSRMREEVRKMLQEGLLDAFPESRSEL